MSDRRGRRRSHYDDDGYYYYDEYEAQPPRRRSLGRQALDKLEDAMASLGLDTKSHGSHGDDWAVARPRDSYYHHDHHRRRHHRDQDSNRRRPQSASPTGRRSRHQHPRASFSSTSTSTSRRRSRSRWERGIEAAAEAAAVEAFRLRHEPGPWRGAKGERVATAALSAGVIGAASEQRKQDHAGGRLGTLGSAVGGLVVNRLVNGPRKEVRR